MYKIKSFRPFLAFFVNYEGRFCVVRFTCDNCGSHNVKPRVKPRKDFNFFHKPFYCGDCDCGYPYYYASSCFHTYFDDIVIQLKLF